MFSFPYVYEINNNKGIYSSLSEKVASPLVKSILVLLVTLVFGVSPYPGIAQAQSEIASSFPGELPALFSGKGILEQQRKDPLAISFWGDVTSGRYRITIQDGGGDGEPFHILIPGTESKVAYYQSGSACDSVPLREGFASWSKPGTASWLKTVDLKPTGVFLSQESDGAVYVAFNATHIPMYFRLTSLENAGEYAEVQSINIEHCKPISESPRYNASATTVLAGTPLVGVSTGNMYWVGGQFPHQGRRGFSMTYGQMLAQSALCLLDDGCKMEPMSEDWGWHCGAGRGTSRAIYLSPIDYSCSLHDRSAERGGYDACGLHHSLYCSEESGVELNPFAAAFAATNFLVRQGFIDRQTGSGRCTAALTQPPACGGRDRTPPINREDSVQSMPEAFGRFSLRDAESGIGTLAIDKLINAKLEIATSANAGARATYTAEETHTFNPPTVGNRVARVLQTNEKAQVVYARFTLNNRNSQAKPNQLFVVNAGVNQEMNCSTVSDFTLVNAETDEPIDEKPIKDGGFLNLDTLPSTLSIRANTCMGERFVLGEGHTEVPGFSYTWSDSEGNVLGSHAESVVALPAGQHTITLTVKDDLGATASDDVVLTVIDQVESVALSLLGRNYERIESIPPYTLFGDVEADYTPGSLTEGTYLLEAISYSKDYGAGLSADTNQVLFDVIRADTSSRITRFFLIDAASNSELFELKDEVVLDPASLPVHLNVMAHVEGGPVESVRFNINPGTYAHVEEISPYALFRDLEGNYLEGSFSEGEQYLMATPYPETKASGKQGMPHRIRINVLESASIASSNLSAKATDTFSKSSAQVSGGIPTEYVLEGNYPNPFNPATTIRFSVPETARIRLAVYDILGREVQRPVDEIKSAGHYEVRIDASSLPSGTYLYRLETPERAFTKSMVLLR